jgi:histone-lysine N-methyltransferase SETMAR
MIEEFPQAKEVTDIKIQDRIILISFFDIRLIIHFEFVPERTTVNQTFYVEVLKRLIDAVRRKRGQLWRGRTLILDHDNAPTYSSLRVSQFLTGERVCAMTPPRYSPDLATTDF